MQAQQETIKKYHDIARNVATMSDPVKVRATEKIKTICDPGRLAELLALLVGMEGQIETLRRSPRTADLARARVTLVRKCREDRFFAARINQELRD